MANSIYPSKLSKNAHIRVIAPSRSASIISESIIRIAKEKLESIGYAVSFGESIFENDQFNSAPVDKRLADLHDAFKDKSVDAIFTMIGGYSANQLLDKIDYELIGNNPKPFVGFSDITTLANAIYAKSGLVTYSGPHFSSWGMYKGFEYSEEQFNKCILLDEPYLLNSSEWWSDDEWYLNQEDRNFAINTGLFSINNGSAFGRIVGGHLRCFSSLQGTKYWPGLEGSILFLEDDEVGPGEFERLMHSLMLLEDFSGVKGIVIGRFRETSNMQINNLNAIFKSISEKVDIPIIVNANFGHTTPITTFPVGGECMIKAEEQYCEILIIKH